MDVVGYARVSSLTQDLDLQISEIKKFAEHRGDRIIRIYTDKSSGKDLKRDGFQDMINLVDKNTLGIQAIIITRIDRIGRNLHDLMKIIDYLESKHVQLVSIYDNIDTTTAQGLLFFQTAAAFAEYERKIISERTEAGRKEAYVNGVKFGRPKKKINIEEVKKEIAMGVTKSAICRKYGIKRATLYNKLKEDKENVKL
jgi:DNA invertase Pin-like site-specific DNA recombinase